MTRWSSIEHIKLVTDRTEVLKFRWRLTIFVHVESRRFYGLHTEGPPPLIHDLCPFLLQRAYLWIQFRDGINMFRTYSDKDLNRLLLKWYRTRQRLSTRWGKQCDLCTNMGSRGAYHSPLRTYIGNINSRFAHSIQRLRFTEFVDKNALRCISINR